MTILRPSFANSPRTHETSTQDVLGHDAFADRRYRPYRADRRACSSGAPLLVGCDYRDVRGLPYLHALGDAMTKPPQVSRVGWVMIAALFAVGCGKQEGVEQRLVECMARTFRMVEMPDSLQMTWTCPSGQRLVITVPVKPSHLGER